MTDPKGTVAWIAMAPVKSMALVFVDHAEIGPAGVVGDRAYAVVDDVGRVVNGKRAGFLATVHVETGPDGALTLRLPNGQSATGHPQRTESTEAMFTRGPRSARVIEGPWSELLSHWSGRSVRLVAVPADGGKDRGPSVTLVSTAALAALAAHGGESEPLDGRRFRMTFGVEGVPAYAEDRWIGQRVRVGKALIQIAGNVGRCAVTTQDPDTGRPTFDTLRALQHSRGHLPTSEPLPFGVWAEVVEPGGVAIGDDLRVEP